VGVDFPLTEKFADANPPPPRRDQGVSRDRLEHHAQPATDLPHGHVHEHVWLAIGWSSSEIGSRRLQNRLDHEPSRRPVFGPRPLPRSTCRGYGGIGADDFRTTFAKLVPAVQRSESV